MKIWAESKTGSDGLLYGLRYMLTVEEVRQLQSIGLLGEVCEVVGMQAAADAQMAMFERDVLVHCGGRVQ